MSPKQINKKPKRRLRDDQIAAALKYCRGMIATAAHNLGVNRSTIYDRVQKSEKLRAIIEDERERMTDFAESKLIDSIKNGSDSAIRYYLSTQGRNRGYVLRTETDLTSDGQRLDFTLNIGSAPLNEKPDDE